jgi:hypothetical protein
MSLLNFISNTIANTVFSPDFFGVPAKYTRNVEEQATGRVIETKETTITVSPQGSFQTVDAKPDEIGARVEVFWAKTEELRFGDEPFLPEPNDIIEFEINGQLQRYSVGVPRGEKMQTSFGYKDVFGYEDAEKKITKITTFKHK